MRFRRRDSVIWDAHLEELPTIREWLQHAKAGRPVVLIVNGQPVEFEPMNGASGWKAVGRSRDFWKALGYPVDVDLELPVSPSEESPAQLPPLPPSTTGVTEPVRPRPADASSREVPRRVALPPAVTVENLPMTARREGLFVGVDVGGKSEKGFMLAFSEWRGGRMTGVHFETLPHAIVLPETGVLAPFVARGDFGSLAAATSHVAEEIGGRFWRAVQAHGLPEGVFIDSPSGLSRNRRGHGRLCERQQIDGVSYQSTPSVNHGVPHGGTWNWLLYGMIAFASIRVRGAIDEALWQASLEEGLHASTSEITSLVVRECFPTATVEYLRRLGRGSIALQAVNASQAAEELERLRVYFERGVRGNKPRGPLGDRTDALIAAMSALPHANAAFEERVLLGSHHGWLGEGRDLRAEGQITLVA